MTSTSTTTRPPPVAHAGKEMLSCKNPTRRGCGAALRNSYDTSFLGDPASVTDRTRFFEKPVSALWHLPAISIRKAGKTTRQRQTHREVGTQSHGPAASQQAAGLPKASGLPGP